MLAQVGSAVGGASRAPREPAARVSPCTRNAQGKGNPRLEFYGICLSYNQQVCLRILLLRRNAIFSSWLLRCRLPYRKVPASKAEGWPPALDRGMNKPLPSRRANNMRLHACCRRNYKAALVLQTW